MARTKKTTSKDRKFEKRNYQDAAEEREYKKGYAAGRGSSNCKFPQGSAKTGSSNDPAWYAKNAQLLEASASFAYSAPVGAPFRLDNIITLADAGANSTFQATAAAIPGLWRIMVAPTPGISIDAQSPINVAATNVYSYVRYKNSGASNYDSPDLMLYLIAMDSLYAAWNWCKRLYGVAASYNQQNRYMPKAYVQANGVDFEDLTRNLADFRAFLNRTAAQITSFCVPATMNYNVRHSWMFANIYLDSDTAKAQQYMFVPAWFYLYDETTSPQGGKLVPISACYNLQALMKTSDVMDILTSMLNALAYSEDIGIMSGDILKAYGESNLFTLSPVLADYSVMPVYNQEVLMQIENLRSVNVSPANQPTFTLAQNPDTNFLTFDPTFTASSSLPSNGTILNMHKAVVTPADSMVASRLITTEKYTNSRVTPIVNSCGSEIVVRMDILTFIPTSANNDPLATFTDYDRMTMDLVAIQIHQYYTARPDGTVIAGSKYQQILMELLLVSKFDWHPALYINIGNNEDTTEHSFFSPFMDVDNYTIIQTNDIDKLNEVALLSLFDVPANGPSF